MYRADGRVHEQARGYPRGLQKGSSSAGLFRAGGHRAGLETYTLLALKPNELALASAVLVLAIILAVVRLGLRTRHDIELYDERIILRLAHAHALNRSTVGLVVVVRNAAIACLPLPSHNLRARLAHPFCTSDLCVLSKDAAEEGNTHLLTGHGECGARTIDQIVQPLDE